MSRRLRLSGKELIKALGKAGFEVARVRGSHHRLQHPDGRKTTVPVHGSEPIGPGLLNKILRDVELTHEQLAEL
ncbi:MAG: type II toxin-antitoxin system HicA family toxin [Verrucomicrobiales bacterium]